MFIAPKQEKINEIVDFLKIKKNELAGEKEYWNLWGWAINRSLDERLEVLVNANSEFKKQASIAQDFSVLDLGCGFCMYWPFLNDMGYNKFIGLDLYGLRRQGNQHIEETANDLVKNFCKSNIKYKIMQADVRNIHMHNNTMKEIVPNLKFDLIIGLNVISTKKGSTGISPDIFNSLLYDYLKPGGIGVYNGNRKEQKK